MRHRHANDRSTSVRHLRIKAGTEPGRLNEASRRIPECSLLLQGFSRKQNKPTTKKATVNLRPSFLQEQGQERRKKGQEGRRGGGVQSEVLSCHMLPILGFLTSSEDWAVTEPGAKPFKLPFH